MIVFVDVAWLTTLLAAADNTKAQKKTKHKGKQISVSLLHNSLCVHVTLVRFWQIKYFSLKNFFGQKCYLDSPYRL